MSMNKNNVGVILNGANELMENVKIDMSLIGWSAASAIIASAVCISTVAIYGLKTYEKLESRKLLYHCEYNTMANLEMIIS